MNKQFLKSLAIVLVVLIVSAFFASCTRDVSPDDKATAPIVTSPNGDVSTDYYLDEKYILDDVDASIGYINSEASTLQEDIFPIDDFETTTVIWE